MASHPYYPLAASIPSYVANESSLPRLLAAFAAMIGILIGLTLWQTTQSPVPMRALDRFAVVWFALCGFLHVGFEGYYLYNRTKIPQLQTVFAQLWKEYALSDSRYLTLDNFTTCIEAITVFAWGPLSWVTYFAILNNSALRHMNQLVVCTAHLYGVALYYATNWAEREYAGVSHSRPEFLYYWVYFIGLNAPWVVVPLVFLFDSYRQTARAFRALHREESARKRQ